LGTGPADLPKAESEPAGSPGDLLAEGASRVESDQDPNSDSLVEVVRQISFYDQLLSFEREVLEQMRSLVASQPQELRRAIERSDIEPMKTLIEQFEQRLRFWQQRDREVGPD
jgi:hypothetical protein